MIAADAALDSPHTVGELADYVDLSRPVVSQDSVSHVPDIVHSDSAYTHAGLVAEETLHICDTEEHAEGLV